MSEQYYQKEDQLPDTPAQLIENFEAQSNSLANVVPEVAIALQQTGEALGQLYDQAQAAGNTGAMALISASWQRTEMIANQTVQLDALKQSAAAAIATIEEERKLVAERLDELETAIHYQDDTHPELKDLIVAVRDEAMEDAMEMAEHLDHIVLFSGDGDFRSLVEAVQRKGVRVSVISTITTQPPMIADELRRQADEFIDLVHLASKIGRDPGERAERMQRYQERRPAQQTPGGEGEHTHEDDDEE